MAKEKADKIEKDRVAKEAREKAEQDRLTKLEEDLAEKLRIEDSARREREAVEQARIIAAQQAQRERAKVEKSLAEKAAADRFAQEKARPIAPVPVRTKATPRTSLTPQTTTASRAIPCQSWPLGTTACIHPKAAKDSTAILPTVSTRRCLLPSSTSSTSVCSWFAFQLPWAITSLHSTPI